jgi:predicted nucleic acid-binding protein
MARVEKVVADASVVVKWYNLETNTENALQLRRDYMSRRVELVAPYLLAYEVANALRYNPDFGAEDVKSAVTDLLNMQMDLRLLNEEQIQTTTDLAFKLGITLYDSAYFALAEAGEMTFYSADDKFIAKVGSQRVRHIRDYGAP